MGKVSFLISYLIVMMFTYLWRLSFLGNAIENMDMSQQELNSQVGLLFFIMTVNYLILAFIAYKRGTKIGKKYLFAFPLVGGFFDIILGFIPFVPTILNIITLVLGVIKKEESITYEKAKG